MRPPRCYRTSLELAPHNPITLNNLGTVYDSHQDRKQAERMYRRALLYRPARQRSHTSALILKNLGTNLLAQHKYDEGWKAYRRAVAPDPSILADTTDLRAEQPVSLHQRGAVNYFTAKRCARARRTNCAVKYLRLSLDEGFTTAKNVTWSSDFAKLRKKPAFQKFLAERNQGPLRSEFEAIKPYAHRRTLP